MFQLIQLIDIVMLHLVRVFFNPLFWIIILLVGMQYQKMAGVRANLFGIEREPVWRHTLAATLYGLIGGIIGSFVIVILGVSLSGINIGVLWMVALLLMLISPRFLCFAYAGGILSLSYLLFGIPQINIPELIGLVAILHMVESILILMSGHLGAVPVFTKDKQGRIIGGFTLQKLWPIPIVLLMAVSMPQGPPPEGVSMPDWWPLITSGLTDLGTDIMYTLIPVVAGLGYGDLALARTPVEKSKISAIYLGIYSVILLLLAILASAYFYPFAFIAALFAPLGHEWIIHLGQKMEFQSKPLYVPPERGVMLLDVNPKSPFGSIGLKSGDIILNLNEYPVNRKSQLQTITDFYQGPMEIEYLKGGVRLERDIVSIKYGEPLGVIPVPEGYENEYIELNTSGFLARWFKRIFRR